MKNLLLNVAAGVILGPIAILLFFVILLGPPMFISSLWPDNNVLGPILILGWIGMLFGGLFGLAVYADKSDKSGSDK